MIALATALATVAAADPWPAVVDARVGPAFLARSRSHAVGHMFKPSLRLGWRVSTHPRLETGAAADAVLDTSAHYRVLGALAHARYALWRPRGFSLGTSAAVGVGHDADILHADLRANGRVAPYGFLALDARWSIGARGLVGVDAAWGNVSVLHLGAVVGWRFGGEVSP